MNKNTKELVPKLRFPDFGNTEGWLPKSLGQFITERNQTPADKIPLYSLTIENGVTPKTERYERSFLVKDEQNAYKVAFPDDFAFNPMNLRFGAIAKHSGSAPVALSKYYNIFYCDKSVDSKFCEIYFKSDLMVNHYDDIATGSLIEKRRVHFSEFLKLNICFPQLEEQQKIADCLSSIDDLISAQSQKVEALKTHKKGLMQQLFPREGETVPRLRFPKFRDAGEWECKQLKDACEKPFSGGTPSTTNRTYYGGTIPFIRSGEIDKHFTELFLTEKGLSNSSAKLVQVGDVLVALYGANSGEVALSKMYGAINQAVLCLRSKTDNTFLYQYLLLKKDEITTKYLQGGQGNLSGDIVKSIELQFPQKSEQKIIADCLSSIDDLISNQSQKLEALKIHKKGLMQQLFPSTEADSE
ncbi:restriction endonuclease subunit S [Shewanella xiamenensis]|uniref:restriction endonuclease subunit S n=1 Tax=Shewanella xiamenensis TaxID=332186 RepID=UPI00217DE6EB|nr:restriction endonuclease subunit S [Shewanella xiamenensis]MCT8860948.1 restriction endonuclease subunit S [Shewanella xiamenensis]UWG64277.1 restriction endonuclease subunit S [Shewanella xiamenensis]